MKMREFAELMKDIIEKSLLGIKEVRIESILKNNSVRRTALIIQGIESNMAQNIYLEGYYQKYENGIAPELLANEIIQRYQIYNAEKLNFDFIFDWEEVKKMVVYKVIGKEKNEELLKEVPYKDILDLVMVCYLSLDNDGASILIHKGLCDMWGISTEELFKTAEWNTPRLFPSCVEAIEDVLCGFFKGAFLEDMKEVKGCKTGMYVLTNIEKSFGAVTMFYQGVLGDLSNKFESDLFILPSSVHELLILPTAEAGEVKGLGEIVQEINATIVAKEEILSDRVYKYSRETKEICIVA